MDRLRSHLLDMATLGERSLQQCIDALLRGDRQLAYAVILRDLFIDAQEKAIDKLCLEFLVRQQPAGEPLRFAFGAIKINLELERVGDYAESIARQIVKLVSLEVPYPKEAFTEIAGMAIPMLRDSIRSFVDRRADLAQSVIEREETVDLLKRQVNARLVDLFKEGKLPLEALNALSAIARRFERVSDQARNISMESLYVSTGAYAKHPDTDVFRILFVDEDGAGAAPIAEAIGTALNQPKFIFTGASLEPRPIPPATAEFLRAKGVDVSRLVPRALNQVPNLDRYHVIVFLAKAAKRAFPQQPQKGVFLDWFVERAALEPSATAEAGSPAALEQIYRFLGGHLHDLVDAILGSNQLKLEGV
jgi:phosphate transport system protein